MNTVKHIVFNFQNCDSIFFLSDGKNKAFKKTRLVLLLKLRSPSN